MTDPSYKQVIQDAMASKDSMVDLKDKVAALLPPGTRFVLVIEAPGPVPISQYLFGIYVPTRDEVLPLLANFLISTLNSNLIVEVDDNGI